MYLAFVGDSFVNGSGDPNCLGWAGRVCAKESDRGENLTYYNLGIRGETSVDIEERWRWETARRLPKNADCRVVFSFGANDTRLENGKTRVELATSVECTRRILDEAKSNYPVLFISAPPVGDRSANERIQKLNEAIARVCQDLDISYLDTFSQLRSSSVWLAEVTANDGAHPRAGGYSELAELVLNWSAWQAWFSLA